MQRCLGLTKSTSLSLALPEQLHVYGDAGFVSAFL